MKRTTAILTAPLLAIAIGCGACANEQTTLPADEAQAINHEYQIKGYMHGYFGVGGEIDGVKNPVLTARAGETVRIQMINADSMPHDVALEAHGVGSPVTLKKGERASTTFTAEQDDIYFCTIPGHARRGMLGEFKLIGSLPGPSSTSDPGH